MARGRGCKREVLESSVERLASTGRGYAVSRRDVQSVAEALSRLVPDSNHRVNYQFAMTRSQRSESDSRDAEVDRCVIDGDQA